MKLKQEEIDTMENMDWKDKFKASMEMQTKEKKLKIRTMKVFAKIRGRNQQSTSPDQIKENTLIERNINNMVLKPCKRVSQALDTVNNLKQDSRDFQKYLKAMRFQQLREKRIITKEYEDLLKMRR